MQEFPELSQFAIREITNVNFPLNKESNDSGDPITKEQLHRQLDVAEYSHMKHVLNPGHQHGLGLEDSDLRQIVKDSGAVLNQGVLKLPMDPKQNSDLRQQVQGLGMARHVTHIVRSQEIINTNVESIWVD